MRTGAGFRWYEAKSQLDQHVIVRFLSSGVPVLNRSGAPRPMKMGATRSPWRYDAVAADAIRPDNQQRNAILHGSSRTAVFPISGLSSYPSAAAISINPGSGAMGQKLPLAKPPTLEFTCPAPEPKRPRPQ